MRVNILANRIIIPQDVRDFARRRLKYALGRFDHAVERVTARFSDENGPRAGGYKCKLLVVPKGTQTPLVVEAHGDDQFSTAAHAAERAGRALTRFIARSRDRRPRADVGV